MSLPAADIFEKAKGVVRDKIETVVLLVVIASFLAFIAHTLFTRANIKEYENTLSWLIGAVVGLAGIFVASEAMQKPPRPRPKPPPTLGDTRSS